MYNWTYLYVSPLVCLVRWILGRIKKKKKWKIGVKMGGNGVWLRGGGEEKSGGAHKFSLLPLQNTISPNWSEKWEKYLGKIAPTSFNVFRSLFFFWLFLSLVMLAFCIFFSYFGFVRTSLVLLLFLFFFFNYFFKKTLLDAFYAIFWNVHFHLYTIVF